MLRGCASDGKASQGHWEQDPGIDGGEPGQALPLPDEPLPGCTGACIAPSGRAEKEQQQGEHVSRPLAPGSSPLPTTCRQEEPVPACVIWQCGSGHGCVCRIHRHLCCLYLEVVGQQEWLLLVATLHLSDFVHSSWMKLCPALAPCLTQAIGKRCPRFTHACPY